LGRDWVLGWRCSFWGPDHLFGGVVIALAIITTLWVAVVVAMFLE
jgi:hypothetical protein